MSGKKDDKSCSCLSTTVNSNIRIDVALSPISRPKLPSKFVTRFGNQVPITVTLQVPNDGGVWLIGKGWAEFISSLSLGYADFLMFEYDAMSVVFHVVVMGMSASEITYPALATDDDPDDNDDDVKPYSTMREGYNIGDSRARAFKGNEPHFIISLQPTYLVPPPFIEAYFNFEVRNVILEAPDRMTWTVVHRQSAHCIYFASGWKQFYEKHGLTVGGACLFELIRGKGNALQVPIYFSNHLRR
uniref:TF-B3 domain-containing protein n=1 Tax=Kalanchoe fedtschenkoi TaxID=63787 RepID=A0A7N0UU89_KALFE